jgi:hypothetical protein
MMNVRMKRMQCVIREREMDVCARLHHQVLLQQREDGHSPAKVAKQFANF